MKRNMTALLLAALLLVGVPAMAQALTLDGTIEAGKTQTVYAPFTGMTQDYTVRVGDGAAAGETLFTLSTQEVRADFDGTAVGVFAQAGDHTQAVEGHYGALMYLERGELYTAECTNAGAGSDNENKIVHPGERVYIRSVSDNDRTGEGRVTAVSGKSFTVQVTLEEDIRYNEQIRIYRTDEYETATCLGTGRISRIDPVAVHAEGCVLTVHVQEGQQVARGDLLLELAPDAPQGYAGGSAVAMPCDGVVLQVLCQAGAQVSKDEPMAVICARGDMELQCIADEDDLPGIYVGQAVDVTLDAYPQDVIRGTVRSIASAPAEGESGYLVCISLEDSSLVRIGMRASAALSVR